MGVMREAQNSLATGSLFFPIPVLNHQSTFTPSFHCLLTSIDPECLKVRTTIYAFLKPQSNPVLA